MPISISDLMRAAEAAYRDQRDNDCAELCHRTLAMDSRHLAAHVLLGMLDVREGHLEDAATRQRQALAIEPNCFEALLWLGIALRGKGDLSEAVRTLRQALRVWPGDPSALAALGGCFLDQHKGGKAALAFREALAQKPQDPALHHNLAAALHLEGDLPGAEREYREALRLDPDAVGTMVNLGQLLLEVGQPAAATEAFRRAHAAEPDTARGLVQLARAQREVGDLDGAEASLREALVREPENVEAMETVGNLLQQLGRFDEAATALDRAIELEPGRSRLYFNRAYCRRTVEADRPALGRMVAALLPVGLGAQERRYLHYALGKAHNDLGEPEAAMRHFDEANRAMREIMGHRPFERDIHTREFDRKIATYTEETFRRDRPLGDPSERPIFIVGMIRSGTTLVEQILSSHAQIGGGGELPFWTLRAHAMTPRGDAPPSPPAVRSAQADYLALLESLAPGMARVTDKMPHNYMYLGQIHTAFPNARIVHCRRHPVDNCLSIYMTPYQSPLDFAHDRENIVFVYREYERLMAHWRSVLPPGRFIEVDYETLANEPEPTVRRLVEFVGLDWDDACLRPEDNRRVVKTPSMWQVRQPVYRSSTERWRKYETWLAEFASLAPNSERTNDPAQ